MQTYILKTDSQDPYYNLALEELAMKIVDENKAILHLWQSEDAVVIGKHQNPWAETDPKALINEDIKLVRRFTGGGTVFHDIGNLNYCFIMDKKNYDVSRQMDVVLGAVKSFKINAKFNCRNDLLANDKKFSGSAFCLKKNAAVHHGTLLVKSDIKRLKEFLKPVPLKITYKGIKSKRSSVVNLSSLNQKVNVESLTDAVIKSFENEYCSKSEILYYSDIASNNEIETLIRERKSNDWLYAHCMPFGAELSFDFDFGNLTLNMHIKKAVIESCEFNCEALSKSDLDLLSSAVIGSNFDSDSILKRISYLDFEYSMDICDWLKSSPF